VTDADRAVERALRERIAAERPRDGVFGEEEGDDGGATRWIIDPIDGTRNFSRGIPVWATLVALEREGALHVGVVSAPALGRRWWAARGGGGAFADGERIHVSSVGEWDDAAVSSIVRLEREPWHARALGDFWQHVLVAEGALDAAVDERLQLWDYAAVQVIVEEAGGRMTDLHGGPPRPGERVVSSNGALHESALAAIVAAS
jgi:histidinol-phosphatase